MKRIYKTTEGIEFHAFVKDPKQLPDDFSLCNGDIAKWLESRYKHRQFGIHSLTRIGCHQEGGWEFDFRPHLKKWLYKEVDGLVHIAYAPNVGMLRAALLLNRHVKIAPCPKNF